MQRTVARDTIPAHVRLAGCLHLLLHGLKLLFIGFFSSNVVSRVRLGNVSVAINECTLCQWKPRGRTNNLHYQIYNIRMHVYFARGTLRTTCMSVPVHTHVIHKHIQPPVKYITRHAAKLNIFHSPLQLFYVVLQILHLITLVLHHTHSAHHSLFQSVQDSLEAKLVLDHLFTGHAHA